MNRRKILKASGTLAAAAGALAALTVAGWLSVSTSNGILRATGAPHQHTAATQVAKRHPKPVAHLHATDLSGSIERGTQVAIAQIRAERPATHPITPAAPAEPKSAGSVAVSIATTAHSAAADIAQAQRASIKPRSAALIAETTRLVNPVVVRLRPAAPWRSAGDEVFDMLRTLTPDAMFDWAPHAAAPVSGPLHIGAQ